MERHAFAEDFLSPMTLTFKDGRKLSIGPLICEDSWDDNYFVKPMTYLSTNYDIDVFVNISSSPFTIGKTQRRHRLLESHRCHPYASHICKLHGYPK